MELSEGVARKRGPSASMSVEAAATRVAVEIGESSGRFKVPNVLRYDPEGGVLETKRIPRFVTLLDLAISGDPRLTDLCHRAGAAAATLHRCPLDSSLPRIRVPEELRSANMAECMIHGDLTGANVGVDEDEGALVILDWSSAPSMNAPATVGPPGFDMLWFMMYFFRTRPVTALRDWRPEQWATAFLEGYDELSDSPSRSDLASYGHAIEPFLSSDYEADVRRRGRGVRWLPYRIWRWAGRRRWDRFVAELGHPRTVRTEGRR